MKKLVLIFVTLLSVNYGHTQVISSLDSLRLQFEQDVEEMREEFEAYEAKARADYDRYVLSIKKVWGEDTIVDNTKKVWVEYGQDYRSRSIVDFEGGGIEVEVAIDKEDEGDSLLINHLLSEAVGRMLGSRGSTCPYSSSVDVSLPLTEKPILEGLVDLSRFNWDISLGEVQVLPKNNRPVPPAPTVKGKTLSVEKTSSFDNKSNTLGKTLAEKKKESAGQSNLDEKISINKENKLTIARKIVAQSKKKVSETKGSDGKVRQVVQVQMHLVADNLSKSAALYKDLVAEFSEKFQIEQPLIFAIMEQESAFNPQAKSWVPAYGLMQLVPTSGGTDAYRYVYKKEWIPTQSYLYDPRNNIELGTAYLRVLMNQFSSVSDVHCRRLCVIAGYNTGAGNVSRSFIGSTNLSKAFAHINSCDYGQLYAHFITRLPYEETRDYVVKVTERHEKYVKE